MMKVEILRLQDDGTQKVLATARLAADKVELVGDTAFIERLKVDGVLDRSVMPPRRLYPADGEDFIKVLEEVFESGYITARRADEV